MQVIADLYIHSPYSIVTNRDIKSQNLEKESFVFKPHCTSKLNPSIISYVIS